MKHSLNQIRIIAGKWRGRRLSFPSIPDLRPTPDRVRETLFNWVSTRIVDANCLDLFAGSGALSFEALSRGALKVVAIEKNLMVIAALETSAQQLKVDREVLEVILADALEWLKHKSVTPFDLVFLDPPYSLELCAPCMQLLFERGWLKPNAWVYFEQDKPFDEALFPSGHWRLIKAKQAGQVYYYLATITVPD